MLVMNNSRVSDNILIYIKYNGPQTAQTLAQAFSVTPMAIRQHLYLHNKNDLVQYYDVKTSRGRPKRLWRLTDKAQKAYQDNSSQQMGFLIHGILDHRCLDEAQLRDLYQETLLKRFVKTLQIQTKSPGFVKILQQLAQEANNLGYLFEYAHIEHNTFILTEHHEPLTEIANQFDFIKDIEVNKYEIILAKTFTVEVINHILKGHYCSQYKLLER